MKTIGLWKSKRDGLYISSAMGLEKEQIDLLKSLAVGDKLVLYVNSDKLNEKGPDLTLKKLETQPFDLVKGQVTTNAA